MHERIVAAMLEDGAHVSSRAESPVAGPAHHNGHDFRVDAPCLETRMERLDQGHVDDVEDVRPIEHPKPGDEQNVIGQSQGKEDDTRQRQKWRDAGHASGDKFMYPKVSKSE